jgi:hypothetical protein
MSMRKLIVLLMILFVASVGLTIGQSRTIRGRCLLEVNGKKYITGACKIEMDKDGSFRVYDLKKRGYFAYVTMAHVGANGYWNGTEKGSHAHDPLGDLYKDGACWKNEDAKVCAWR